MNRALLMTVTVLAVTILVTGSMAPALAGMPSFKTQVEMKDKKGNTLLAQTLCGNEFQSGFGNNVKGKLLVSLGGGDPVKAPGGTDRVNYTFDLDTGEITSVNFLKNGVIIGSITPSGETSINMVGKLANSLVCQHTVPKGTTDWTVSTTT